MEHHGLKVAEGSEVTNLTAPTGTQFPGDENAGEFFFRTDENKLYLYGNSSWDEVQTGTAAALANFQDNGSVGEVYYDHGGGGQTLRLSTSATGLTYTGLLTGTQARYEGTNAYIEFHDTDSGTDTLDHFRINQFGANLQIEAKNNSWAHVRNVANFTHAGNLELPVGNLIATSGGVTATSGTGAFQDANVSATTTTNVLRASGAQAYIEIGDTGVADSWRLYPTALSVLELFSYTGKWSGTAERSMRITRDAGVELFYNSGVTLATESFGASVTGRVEATAFRADDTNLTGGFQMATTGGEHYAWAPEAAAATLYSYTAEWSGTAERLISATKDAGVSLYFNNSVKIATSNTGATITGALTAGTNLYPTVQGSDGQVLTTDGAGVLAWESAGLDTSADYSWSGTHTWTANDAIVLNNNIAIKGKESGGSVREIVKITAGNVITFGGTGVTAVTGSEVRLQDGGSTKLTTTSDGVDITGGWTTTGVSVIDNNIAIQGKESGGSLRDLIKITAGNVVTVGGPVVTAVTGSEVRLQDGGSTKLATTSSGVDITGGWTVTGDCAINNNIAIQGKESGGSLRDMISMTAGNVVTVGSTVVTAVTGSEVRLQDNGSTKLTTTSSGVTVTGTLIAGTNTYPIVQGSDGQVLTTNGSGTLAWESAGVDTAADYSWSGTHTWTANDAIILNNNVAIKAKNTISTIYEVMKINATSDLIIGNAALDTFVDGSPAALRNSGTTKLETSANGIDITGGWTTTGDSVLNNNIAIRAKNTVSTQYDILILNNSNDVIVGNSALDTFVDGSPAALRNSGSTKLETTSTGVDITGGWQASGDCILNNNIALQGRNTVSTAYDLIVFNNSNDIIVGNSASDIFIDGSPVILRNSGVSKLETITTGIDIFGGWQASGDCILDNNAALQGRNTSLTPYDLIVFNNSNDIIVGTASQDMFIDGSPVILRYSGVSKLETATGGIEVIGNAYLSSSAGAVTGVASGGGGEVNMIGFASGNQLLVGSSTKNTYVHGAAVHLYDGGVKKFETTTAGTTTTGQAIVTGDVYLSGGGSVTGEATIGGEFHLIGYDGGNQLLVGSTTKNTYVYGATVRLYDAAVLVFETVAAGTKTTGTHEVTGALTAGTNLYPTVQGSTGQVLTTNGSGTLTWAAAGTSLANFQDNGSAGEITFGGSAVKLASTTTGITVTGTLIAGTNTYPTVQGSTGQVLTTNGSGTLTWAATASSLVNFQDNSLVGEVLYNSVVKLASSNTGIDVTGLLTSGTATVTGLLTSGTATVTGELTAGGNAFPTNTGTNGYYLETDGAGQTSWTAIAEGSSLEQFQDNGAVAEIYYDHGQGGETLIAVTSATGMDITGDLTVSGDMKVGDGTGSPATATIDFDSSGLATSYDVQLSTSGGTATDGEGTFTVNAIEMDVMGTLNVSTDDVSVLTIGDAIANTPEIQFQSGGAGADYDTRITSTGGTASDGEGTLNIDADSVEVSCDVSLTGGDIVVDSIDKNLDLFTRKAMCHVEIGGSPSPLLTNFFGVTSVTRNNAGDFSLTMTDSWADTAVARAKIFATVSRHFLSGGVCNVTRVDVSSTNQIDIIFQDATPVNADPTYFSVTVEHVV